MSEGLGAFDLGLYKRGEEVFGIEIKPRFYLYQGSLDKDKESVLKIATFFGC